MRFDFWVSNHFITHFSCSVSHAIIITYIYFIVTIKVLIIDYLAAWCSGQHQLTPDRSQGALAAVLHHPAAGLAGTSMPPDWCSADLERCTAVTQYTTNLVLVFYFIPSAPHRSNQAFTFQKISFVCFRENVLLLNQSA